MPRTLEVTPGEELLPIATAIELETGRRPHPTTCSRWVQKGAGGVMLPTVLLGSRRMTTRRAVREWILERSQLAA